MPSIQDYMDVFEPIVERGEAVICICITMKFSGSFQSATQAKQMILEEHPDAEITIIDSTLDTVCQGIYVLEAVKMCTKITLWVFQNRLEYNSLFGIALTN